MSIIEKAMNKLDASRAQTGQRRTAGPTVIEHPAVAKALSKNVAALGSRVLQEVPTCQEHAGSPCIGRLSPSVLWASHDQRVTEEYRRIKRPLLANAFGKGILRVAQGNLIMVTSSLSGEGKTFASINLSLSVALERNYTVLLIDADVAKRELSKLYSLETGPGLTDILLNDDLDVRQTIASTDFPGLKVLPAGQPHPQAAELLASRKMEALVTELSQHYPKQVMIFDSSLLVTSESLVLAGLVGQIVFLVEAGATPQHVVREALAALDSSKATNLVLNKSRRGLSSDYYGYVNEGGR